jgi:hypothetical protein
LLGHTTDRVTRRYAHIAPAHLHRVIAEKLPTTTAMVSQIPHLGADAESGNDNCG